VGAFERPANKTDPHWWNGFLYSSWSLPQAIRQTQSSTERSITHGGRQWATSSGTGSIGATRNQPRA
jgi:hypothetical protein